MKTKNNITRAFCFVLIAIMTLSMMPISLFETVANAQTKATEINEISITNVNLIPVVGKTVAESISYTLPSDAPFTVTYNGWHNDTNSTNTINEYRFEAGKNYSRGLKFKANDGYTFAKNPKVLINGSEEKIDKEYTCISNSDKSQFYVWTVSIEAVAEINEISISDADITPLLGKTAGELLNYTIPADAPFTVEFNRWHDDTIMSTMDNDSVFEAAKDYSRGWKLNAKAGYTFTENTKVLVNGSNAHIDPDNTFMNNSDNSVFYVWTIPSKAVAGKEKIDTININDAITTPIAGKTAGESFTFTLPDNAPYTVYYYCWYDETENKEMSVNSIFEKYGKYSFGWQLKAKDGYTFTKDTKVLINNSTAAIDTSMTAISKTDSTVFSVWTIAAEAVTEAEKIDTININDAITTPIAGKTAGESFTITLPDNAPYTVSSHGWYNDTDEVGMDDESIFEKEKMYSLNWTIQAKEGYTFTKDTKVLINNSTAAIDTSITAISETDSTVFSVWSIPTKSVIEIQTIDITDADITPIAGKTAGELLAYTIPADAPYTVNDNFWNNDSKYGEMDDADVFEEGNFYSHGWYLKAKDGYTFTKNTKVLINGSESNVNKEWTWIDDSDSTIFYVWANSVEVTGTGEVINIDTININNADIVPILGKTASEVFYSSVPADAPYTISDTVCINITDNKPMNVTDVFEADKEYIFGWILNAKTGCVFTEDTKVLINGKADYVNKEASKIYENPKQFGVWTIPTKAVADSEKISIDTITISNANTTPIAGKTAGECIAYTIPADAPYIVTECSWYDMLAGRFMDNSSVFEAGKIYLFGWLVKANDGYTFTEETKVLLNGSETDINTDFTEIDDHNSSIFYVASIPTEAAAPKYEPGDVNLDGKVNTGDAVMILRQVAGAVTFNAEQTSLADFNGDGKVNTGDAVAILKFCVGIKSEKLYKTK